MGRGDTGVKVTVYGHTGTVGRQLFRWLNERGLESAGVSLDERIGDANDSEWAFLCLPTPTTEDGQDLTAIEAVAAQLARREMNVVIRSTVVPGTCARLQAEHPEWHIFHWPEFLSARTAWKDFCKPWSRVIGGDSTAWINAGWPALLPRTEHREVYTDTTTAELIKYTHNLHGAMQVIFANLLADMAVAAGQTASGIFRSAVAALRYISPEIMATYWNIYQDGYRGYGGACFPKDVAAIQYWLKGKTELLDGMTAANIRLRSEG